MLLKNISSFFMKAIKGREVAYRGKIPNVFSFLQHQADAVREGVDGDKKYDIEEGKKFDKKVKPKL